MWWSRIVLVLRSVAVTWAVFIGIGGALQHYEIIPATPNFEVWAWIASIVLIGVENAGTLSVRHFRAKKEGRNERIEATLKSALLQITQAREVSYQDLGASVYVPTWWHRVRRTQGLPTRLKRITRFRPAGYPQQSGVEWTGAKGCVGRSWTEGKHDYMDYSAIAAKYSGATMTPAQFAKIPVDVKRGFTQKEFSSIMGKYTEVVAEPIWHVGKDGVLIGVLSIDRALEPNENPMRVLGKRSTRETAATAAASVGSILKPKVTET